MAPQPLFQVLGELPSGKVAPLSPDELGRFLRDRLGSDCERRRKERMEQRIRRFHDRDMVRLVEDKIDFWFEAKEVRDRFKRLAALATFQNLMRRVVEEISVVYAEPADRRVEPESDARYQDLIHRPTVLLDARMRRANEYVNLCNEAVIWYRVRADLEPELRVWTPDRFTAIAHPLDPVRLVALVFPIQRMGFPTQATEPHWQVWTDYETFQLSGNGHILAESYVVHGLGRMPCLLVHRKDPTDCLLDEWSGEDLVSAQDAILLLNLLMLKEQRSGTKVPYVAGDISNTALGQPMDRESMTVFQEGIAPGTLDLGADPRTYIEAGRAVIKQVAANYGIPESVFDLSYQATSGFEIELKRTGLREKRLAQIMYPWRPAERELAAAMQAVTDRHLPASAFALEGWRINFGDLETPRDPSQRLEVWHKRREMSLMTTVEMIVADNPEMTPEDAERKLEENITAEVERVERLRALQALDAGPNTSPSVPPMGQPAGGGAAEPDEETDGNAARVQRPRSGGPPRLDA
jgi:hypothetical protein